MIDMEKVIKGLEKLRKDLGYGLPDRSNVVMEYLNSLTDAITLLKEQEAVEARKKNDGKPQPWTSWWYVCGACGQEIEYHDRFCRWCGRSVKRK